MRQQYSSIKIGAQDVRKNRFLRVRKLGAADRPGWDVYSTFFFNTTGAAPPPRRAP